MILFVSNMFVFNNSVCCLCCYHEHCLETMWEDNRVSQKTLITGIDENINSDCNKDPSLTFKNTNRKETPYRMKLLRNFIHFNVRYKLFVITIIATDRFY